MGKYLVTFGAHILVNQGVRILHTNDYAYLLDGYTVDWGPLLGETPAPG
jgi:hypothetical protein